MPDILIRGLEPGTVDRLKRRAKLNGRSLQSEAKLLLEQAAGRGREHVDAILEKWQRRLAGRRFVRSSTLIRQDRKR